MTGRLALMQSSRAPGVVTPGIPGISEVELDAMQAAAVSFLQHLNPDTASEAAVLGDMQLLRKSADLDAAGLVSARRSTYWRTQGTHFMTMPHHAE